MLRGADAGLIVKADVPKSLEISLPPRFVLSCDRWVVFVEGGVVLVERGCYHMLVLVGRVRKYEVGEFSSF